MNPNSDPAAGRESVLFAEIAALISSQFEIPAALITPETRLADLDLDSVALVELAAILEEELGVDVSETPIAMEDLVGAIAWRLARAEGRE
jgi:acyl carrier protein